MKLDVFRSGPGDCLLLTSPGGTRILADAGVPEAYTEHIAKKLGKLRKDGFDLDVVYVSHIDRDHIGGVLRMFDTEVDWRVFDHMTAKGKTWKKPSTPRPPAALAIWHNAFFETIDETKTLALGTAGISHLLNAAATTLAAADNLLDAAKAQLLALSVGDAIEVNWRISAGQLGIPLNPEYGGKLMVRRDEAISLGDLTIRVLSPTSAELEKLRKTWIAWLKDKQAYVEKLRRQHQGDVDRLASADPGEIISAINALARAVEKDVTAPNLASLVLLVEQGSRRMLLTGDAGEETILTALEKAGLVDGSKGTIDVDVLKVPHHGAHNSYSEDFVRRVRAKHYIFCGDGEHDNPERDVVRGYLRLRGELPGKFKLWFNCSSKLAPEEFVSHWKTLEKDVADAVASNTNLKSFFLKKGVSFSVRLS